MAATKKRGTRLSDEDVAEVMALIKDSDSVELKLTIPETEHSSTGAALKMDPEAFERRLVVEFWLYPDGSRILELSTECAPAEAFQAAAETRAFLAGQGVHPDGARETKTRKALEFSARLKTVGIAA